MGNIDMVKTKYPKAYLHLMAAYQAKATN